MPLPGEIGVVATHHGNIVDKFASWAIRWGTDSTVNHAFLYAGDGQIIEAVREVRLSPWDSYPGTIWSGSMGFGPDKLAAVAAGAQRYLGESYNVLDIVAIALAQARLGHLVDGDEWWVRRLSDPAHLICSQLCDQAYLDQGIHLFNDGRLPGLVSPGDLLDYIREHQ